MRAPKRARRERKGRHYRLRGGEGHFPIGGMEMRRWAQIPVARELAPVGVRSAPQHFSRYIKLVGFTTASQPNGGKPPRHNGSTVSPKDKTTCLVWSLR